MATPIVKYPFEAASEHVIAHADHYVDAVFASLESEFLVMPRGNGFVRYPAFEDAYEATKRATSGFTSMNVESLWEAARDHPLVLIVLRTMLGLSPPEWAYLASARTGVEITQSFARTIDRDIRMGPERPLRQTALSCTRVQALIETACVMLCSGAPEVSPDQVHRLSKVDTLNGTASITHVAGMGVPYAMLLYERFLGRPFAGHRDSVSELIGAALESAVEEILLKAGVSYRKTQRAEKIEGFDQAPDFVIPSEFNPQVVIEAKLTEDDGTARNKVTRIQHLGELSITGASRDNPRFEVVACIAGRGFGVRREDMRKMIIATRGKVFTLKTLDRLIENTRLRDFAVR